jgi:CubicO group peptidase (beta-lactamase class C family)
MRLLALPILVLTLPATLVAQQPNLTAYADTVFAQWNSTHTPGCALGVERGGQVLLTRGYGMADLETGLPIGPGTIFESGSVAKQFTATAVVLLALDGKLNLDDPVRKYIPELPEYGRPITIRHLLTHTSGIREWSALVAAAGWPRGTRAHQQTDLLDIVFRQTALNYPVGDFYSYTNSGYAIAMTLVERVSGKTFQAFTQERIFGPLGMTHTEWRDDFTRLVPGRAQAYERAADGWHLAMPFESVVGPGGLLTTVGDWLIWNEALTHRTLGPALVDSLTRRMRLTGGRQIQYALGLFIDDYGGVPQISHAGSTAGYSTFLARYPDRGGLSIAVLCNAAGANAPSYAHKLADRLITDFPPAPALDTTRVDSAAFARNTGVYRSDRTGAPLVVGAGTYTLLRALPDGWFWQANGVRWHVDLGPGGTPVAVRLAQPDGDTVRFSYVQDRPWTPTREQLQTFAGAYRSEEVGATYEARLAGDSLTLSPRAGMVSTLRPIYTDGFMARGYVVWFTRNRQNRVDAMHVGESRLWNLVLPRVR